MAETNKSQMLSEAEIIEAINANTLVSISLGKGQPQKNVTLSTLATVVAGILGISKSELYTQISYQNSAELKIDGVGVLLIQIPTYSTVYHLAIVSSGSVEVATGGDLISTNETEVKLIISAANGTLLFYNNRTTNLVVRAYYYRIA